MKLSKVPLSLHRYKKNTGSLYICRISKNTILNVGRSDKYM